MKIDLPDLLPKKENQCKYCSKTGTIVGLAPFSTNLHVFRKCETDGCENNFDHNNGKQWSEVKPYKDYSSTELREILKWIDANNGVIVNMFEGNNVVVGWDGNKQWRFQRLDQNNDNNPADFMPQQEYAIMRIKEVLNEADARVSKLSNAKSNTGG